MHNGKVTVALHVEAAKSLNRRKKPSSLHLQVQSQQHYESQLLARSLKECWNTKSLRTIPAQQETLTWKE